MKFQKEISIHCCIFPFKFVFFSLFLSSIFQTVRSLLTNLNTVAADEMQTILTLAEHLRSSYENEMERVKQAQKQYDELHNRCDDIMKQWSNDKEKLRQQRNEIGEREKYETKIAYDKEAIRAEKAKTCSLEFQIRPGVNVTPHFFEIKCHKCK